MSGGLQIEITDGMAVYPMKNFNAHVVSYWFVRFLPL